MTGGAGFIGSALIRTLINETDHEVINVDKLTYAGNLDSLSIVSHSPHYTFEQADICDTKAIEKIFETHKPTHIMHLAAETHVDRSIDGAAEFLQTNIIGTYVLLDTARHYWDNLPAAAQKEFRFHHISTDEVYGDLSEPDDLFTENTAYDPSSPYAASKASSDHLVRAWGRTYGLPVILTNCSNNYGPYQFPEKLIPHMILNALSGKALPIYGDGHQIRDWLYVEDHAKALFLVLTRGQIGETYNIGGHNEKKNIEVIHMLCDLLEELATDLKPKNIQNYKDLITFVKDRPGHDRRYAIDASKIENELGWKPQETFETGLRKTVQWYLQNESWWSRILNGTYTLERIGIATEKKEKKYGP